MEVDITRLKVGTQFEYKGEWFQVTDDREYPFIEARRLKDKKGYLFSNFEKVTVPDNTVLAKRYYAITDNRTGKTTIHEMKYKGEGD